MFYNVITENSDFENTFPGIQESYTSTDDAARMLYEAECNDYALFEGLIMSDFNEVAARASGAYTEAEIRTLNENILTDAWEKIKELFKKLGAKIKAIFNKFIVFITGVFVRDNKQLLKLHSDKISSKDTSKLKVDWRDATTLTPSKFVKEYADNAKNNFTKEAISKKISDKKTNNGDYPIPDTIADEILKGINNGLSAKMSSSDIANMFLQKAKKKKFSEVEAEVRSILADGKEPLSEAKDSQKEINELIKDCIQEIDDMEKETADQKEFLQASKKCATAIQATTTKVVGAAITAIKDNMKQARKAWLAAASYNPKNESAFDAIDAMAISEAVDFDLDTDYDSFCLN